MRWIASGCDAHPANSAAMASDAAAAHRRETVSRRFSIIDHWPNIFFVSQRLVRRMLGASKALQRP
ncbi:hypothetical protein [Burkholderia vietnamiensis]|uniref:hypothetical protein n=1 Tax=Burkholderia vietnamiensis TaxID=60552 RepID=UPI00201207A4|nr:hypothetical protein [Burkholderia vietnamiensis]